MSSRGWKIISLQSPRKLARWALDLPDKLVLGVLVLCAGIVYLGYWQWAIAPYALVCTQIGIVIGHNLRRLEEISERNSD